MKWKQGLHFAEELICRYEDDEVSALGAQLTYYLILAFFPFLIFLLTLIGMTPLSQEEVWSNLKLLLPETSYRLISDIIRQILVERNDTLLSVGMIGTLWAASNGVTSIIKGLNKAFDETENRPWWKLKGLALFYTVAIATVLTVMFCILVFGHLLARQVFRNARNPDELETVWGIIKYGLPVGVALLVFLLLYRNGPNRRLTFRSAMPGAVFASVGWIVISMGFAAYVNHFNTYTRTYGSIGGVIVLLIWLYLSSTIILIGGEINAMLLFEREGREKPKCKSFGSRIMFWRKSD